MTKPWETLRFVSKVEILPSSGSIGVFVSLEEDNEYVEFSMGQVRMIGQDRKLRLTDERVVFHYDYPEEFKKLVAFYHGDYENAYDVYKALQKPVPSDWETCNKDGEYDCDCC